MVDYELKPYNESGSQILKKGASTRWLGTYTFIKSFLELRGKIQVTEFIKK